jgi:5-methylcytosine-specific restriction enzyme A
LPPLPNIMFGIPRSGKWPKVRKAHLKLQPYCMGCGCSNLTQLEAHHIIPFYIDKTQELNPSNLLTLCSSKSRCHFVIGHLSNWTSWNVNVIRDAAIYFAKLEIKPDGKRIIRSRNASPPKI